MGKHKVQRRFRHYRRLKQVLLCLGLVGIVLGMLMLCAAFLGRVEVRGCLRIGIVYLAVSLGLLGIRAALNAWADMHNRKYARPLDMKPVSHVMRAAPAPVVEGPPRDKEQGNGAAAGHEPGDAK